MPPRKAERIFFPDEEPEKDWVATWQLDGCTYCGLSDHERKECPVRPLSDWTPFQKKKGK